MKTVSGRNLLSTRKVLESTTAGFGIALVVAALIANQPWLDRHFLPSFFIPRDWYARIETVARIVVGASGVGLVWWRARLVRLVTQAPGTSVSVVVAAVLAITASELALRWIHLRPTEWLVADEEPRRQVDARLGWVLAPARTGRSVVGGRTIEYAIDRAGYRTRRFDDPVDLEQAAIVFAGESVMFGEGLTWDESIPAQVGALLDARIINLAVHGYSTDQIYLRLERELPRFRAPTAVVSIFMPELFGRNLDDDRPHLAPGLVWQPAQQASRLASLAALLVPYRREETVERGFRMTHDVLHATVELAHGRSAAALIVVPQFGGDDGTERAIRERILADDIPHVVVPLDPDWRLPWDRHPNARAARVIATAIAERLRAR